MNSSSPSVETNAKTETMGRVVLVICDGHRADFVRQDTCPRICDFLPLAEFRQPPRNLSVRDTRQCGIDRHWLLAGDAWPARQYDGPARRRRLPRP